MLLIALSTVTQAAANAAHADPSSPQPPDGGPATSTAVIALSGACAALAAIVLAMSAVDVPYFCRTLFAYVSATWCHRRRPLGVLDAAVYTSVCLTTDLDVYLSHMNNARYLREIDLARVEFVLRTGLWRELRRRGGLMFTIANSVRYRKFVRTFSRYEIRNRLVYWDDVSVFFEYRFVTKADGFVRAIVYNRQRVVGCGADELVRAVAGAKADGGPVRRPECPAEIHHWIQSNLVSSVNLRAESDAGGGGDGGGLTDNPRPVSIV